MTEQQNKRRGQIQALLLMLVVALPMICAYTIYHTGWGMPVSTVNKGQLVEPPFNIELLSPQHLDDTEWTLAGESKRWRYLLPGAATCDQLCRDNLYLTRQVHIRLNEKARRVERLYLLLDDQLSPELTEFLATEHPKLKIVRADSTAFAEALASTNYKGDAVSSGQYFLMDQEGYVMLSYSPKAEGADLLKDVKKMLKTSYE